MEICFPPTVGHNMKRHQLLSQTSVYLQEQHPGDANLAIDDLRAMVNTMSRLQRYASKVQESSQYCYHRHQELKCLLEQMGPPTFFWAVSSADNHWPNLHRLLLHSSTSPSRAEKHQAVIDCPHVTDWYFTNRLQDFVEHWLYASRQQHQELKCLLEQMGPPTFFWTVISADNQWCDEKINSDGEQPIVKERRSVCDCHSGEAARISTVVPQARASSQKLP